MAPKNQQENAVKDSLWAMAKRLLAAVAALESQQDRENLETHVAHERDDEAATHADIGSSAMAIGLTWAVLIAGAIGFVAYWLLG